ncbi:flagellar hook-length control protein FliK [Sphingomonas sp. RP10(2022)]|uniref:Flagellar hook-length control protein FliK n=1 Tax=Sphingomonas liriopis TaxID=2949094 RepID=A0A9X2KPS1_9SPHN|nr:flagellar hook-length control protein FliK [Sphingomonas liriopis]MCP3734979.1 flagellar hook-length control protein FliK [Sphingomonas liriopis]
MPAALSTPSAPAPQRQTFVREVAGTPRQTVALRPQAAPARQPAAGTTAPAAEVFGAAMHAASADERERGEPLAPTIAAVAAPAEVRPATTVADTGQPTLDTTRGDWPNTMIDHIERLRDAADAQDTRIRLVPDALGAIAVSVKSVGDAIHVRFAAEDATTRALIEDASPKLAQIAEERGVRIGQTIVEAVPASAANQQQAGGQQPSNGQSSGQSAAGQSPAGNQQQTAAQPQTGQQQPRQQQPSTPRQPDRPARAPTRDSDAAADGRLA